MVWTGAQAIDLTGQRFGRLTVTGRSSRMSDSKGHALWDCRCDCGTAGMFRSKSLRRGDTRSCGCLRRELARETIKKTMQGGRLVATKKQG